MHFLNTVVIKDFFLNFFFILYCDFVFFKSSGIEFHKFAPLHYWLTGVVCSVKLLMYIIALPCNIQMKLTIQNKP